MTPRSTSPAPPEPSSAASAPTNGPANSAHNERGAPPTGQRQHILDTALRLMAQRGVDGTSMRDLANAAGLNVASLYHYFPSKRDLLVAVLDDRGFLDDLASAVVEPMEGNAEELLGQQLQALLASMLDVEEFIRLMFGEALRGDETALTIGTELMSATLAWLEQWLREVEPALTQAAGSIEVARLLRAWLIGNFFEYVTGVMTQTEGDEPAEIFQRRALEAAHALLASPDTA